MNIKSFNSFNENSENTNYMFFANLEHICKMARELLAMDEKQIDEMLTDGHDWANDHISKSMESISHVYNFLTVSDLDNEEHFETEIESKPEEFEDPMDVEIDNMDELMDDEPVIEESIKSFKNFK